MFKKYILILLMIGCSSHYIMKIDIPNDRFVPISRYGRFQFVGEKVLYFSYPIQGRLLKYDAEINKFHEIIDLDGILLDFNVSPNGQKAVLFVSHTKPEIFSRLAKSDMFYIDWYLYEYYYTGYEILIADISDKTVEHKTIIPETEKEEKRYQRYGCVWSHDNRHIFFVNAVFGNISYHPYEYFMGKSFDVVLYDTEKDRDSSHTIGTFDIKYMPDKAIYNKNSEILYTGLRSENEGGAERFGIYQIKLSMPNTLEEVGTIKDTIVALCKSPYSNDTIFIIVKSKEITGKLIVYNISKKDVCAEFKLPLSYRQEYKGFSMPYNTYHVTFSSDCKRIAYVENRQIKIIANPYYLH